MNRLRKIRRAADKTQMQLMRETGIFYATISKIERDWVKPNRDQIAKLSEALGVEEKWLFPEDVEDFSN